MGLWQILFPVVLAIAPPGGAQDSIAQSPSLLAPYDVAGVVDESLEAPLGRLWTDWLKGEQMIFMGPGETYVGPSPYPTVDGFEQEWLYRYRWRFASGSTDWYAYGLGGAARPTLERLRTEIRWWKGWTPERLRDLYRAFRDTLTTRLGRGVPVPVANQRDAFGPAFFIESVRYGTARGAIRLSIGNVWMEDGGEHPTVILEHYSAGLQKAVATEPALESTERLGWQAAGAGLAAKLSA